MPKLNFTELLIATRNQGKIREFKKLLADLPIKLRGLNEMPPVAEPYESGETFEENAAIKASEYAKQYEMYVFSDDSGLEVTALNGRPGVHSARYGGIETGYDEKITKLLNELSASADNDRRAAFRCVIALSAPDGNILHLAKGECAGTIAYSPSGENGFGYDPIFIPDGYDSTFGKLPDIEKQKVSHRGKAALAFIDYLMNNLNN